MSTSRISGDGAMTTEVNGTSPPDPLAPYIEGLQGELAPLTARRAQLEAELTDVAAQEQRIKDGLAALRLRAPRQPSSGKRDKHDWSPSQKTLDDVYAALSKCEGPTPVTVLADMTGVSRGTVEKAIKELRKTERVRFVGQGGRGKANLFSVMPSE